MSTSVISEEKVFPTITTVTYAINELRQELAKAKQEEGQLSAQRTHLLQQPATEENDQMVNDLEAELLIVIAKKQRLVDRISESEKSLPVVKAEAQSNEKELSAARKKVELIRSQISELDS